jgi:hypothetical protein
VTLIDGASACNVFWQVGSSATLNVDADFAGTLLVATSVTVGFRASVNGRVLANGGAVTMNTNAITTPDCTPGSLDIAVPKPPLGVNLRGGPAGSAITGQLGDVMVTDSRGPTIFDWTAFVTCTDFKTGLGISIETVLASQVSYWSGPATSTSGDGDFNPGQANAPAAEPLSDMVPLQAFRHVNGTAINSAVWSPTLVVHVPPANLPGRYTGTVTHSVV